MSNFVYSDFWDREDPDDPMRRFDVHENGKNIGHATVKENPDGYVWISGIYVDPAHRGRGLGDALMKQVYRAYPGNEFRLRARPYKDKPMDTADLLSYYKKRGFEPYDKENRMVKTAADNDLKMRRHHLPVRERVEGIITDGEGNVLLQARGGYVEMPGGGIDRGESPKDALKREAMEEAGVKLKNIKKKSVIESWWFPGIKDTDWGRELWEKYRGSRTHFFTAEADGPLREPTSDEGDGWEGKKWMRKGEAMSEMKSNDNSYGMSDYRDEQKKLVQKTAFMEGYLSKTAREIPVKPQGRAVPATYFDVSPENLRARGLEQVKAGIRSGFTNPLRAVGPSSPEVGNPEAIRRAWRSYGQGLQSAGAFQQRALPEFVASPIRQQMHLKAQQTYPIIREAAERAAATKAKQMGASAATGLGGSLASKMLTSRAGAAPLAGSTLARGPLYYTLGSGLVDSYQALKTKGKSLQDWEASREAFPDLLAERGNLPERARRDLDYAMAENVLGHPVLSMSHGALRASEGDIGDESKMVGSILKNVAGSAHKDMSDYSERLTPDKAKFGIKNIPNYAAAYPWMYASTIKDITNAIKNQAVYRPGRPAPRY
jgi:8-oxo-dGTP pyrophosphatase MutT (NUDIX family)